MRNILAFILLIIFVPFLVMVSLLILLLDNQWPFFLQNRVGLNKKNFTIYKLRTFKKGNVTRLGKILRRFSIDEIPQLINIIKGDMNYVGPRPLTSNDIERLNWIGDEYYERWTVKPGITGLAQIQNICSAERSLEKDFFYIKNKGFKLDIIICIRTVVQHFKLKT